LFAGGSAVTALPPYLTVQMVRFFYKADVQQKAKILRKVRLLGQQSVLSLWHRYPSSPKAYPSSPKLTGNQIALHTQQHARWTKVGPRPAAELSACALGP
jgi:hypothetical protein